MKKTWIISTVIVIGLLFAGMPMISFNGMAASGNGIVMAQMNADPVYGVQGTDVGTDRNVNITAINLGPTTLGDPESYVGNTAGAGWIDQPTDVYTWDCSGEWGTLG